MTRNSVLPLFFALLWSQATVLRAAPPLTTSSAPSESNRDFILTIPAGWERIPSTIPGVRVALRWKEGPYPTFNVVAQPGTIQIQESETERLASAVLAEYRLVGFTDATLADTRVVDHPQGPRLQIRVLYEYRGDPIRATVTLVAARSQHFVLTLTEQAGRLSEGPASLADSFSLGDEALPPARGLSAPEQEIGSDPVMMLGIFFLILLLGAFAFRNQRPLW